MSTVYNLEPPTKGKVVIKTNFGDLDVELWAKEAPQAVRNFVQLCLEGYYDGTIFHRIIKDFVIQGGDPTGSGTGGESIYGQPFKDEFNSRLKFSRRGLVACANQNAPHTNGSQFFVTLNRCDGLDRKNTIFGRLSGDGIYTALKIAEVEVGDDDRPEDPPLIISTDVLWNPFEDIVPRSTREEREAKAKAQAAAREKQERARQRREGKALQKLSFGDEAEADEEELKQGDNRGVKAAHDILDGDAKLQKLGPEDERSHQERLAAVRQALRAGKAADEEAADTEGAEKDFSEIMLSKAKGRQQRQRPEANLHPPNKEEPPASPEPARAGTGDVGGDDEDEEDDDDDDDRGKGRLELVKKGKSSRAAKRQAEAAALDLNLLTDYQASMAKYKHRKRAKGARDKANMERLKQWQQKRRQEAGAADAAARGKEGDAAKREEGGQGYDGLVRKDIDHAAYLPAAWRVDDYLSVEAEEEAVSLASLRAHGLKFNKLKKRDEMERSDDVNDYVVVDPLLEAGKAKFNKKVQAMKKRNAEWAGGSRT